MFEKSRTTTVCANLSTMRTLTASTLSRGYRPIGRHEANRRSTLRKANMAMCCHGMEDRNLKHFATINGSILVILSVQSEF